MNKVMLIGRICNDLKKKYIGDSTVVQVSLAVQRRSKILKMSMIQISFNANCGDTMRIFLKKTSQRVTWSHLKVQSETTTTKKMVLSTIQTK